VLVTSVNSGVGFVAARELASRGPTMMVCRHQASGEEARERLAHAATGATPELLLADLSSQADIRSLAEEIESRQTLVYAAAALELDGVNRRFSFKCRERATSATTHEAQLAERLWHIGDELCSIGSHTSRRNCATHGGGRDV
jgi:NAD(P)-dependent dehydrogenase (short-subunit alcohol dehydrogenase family)